MKKVANILFLVGGIYSIVSVASLAIAGVFLLVFSGTAFTATIVQGINDGTINSSFTGTPEQIAAAIQLMFLIMGICFVVIASFGIVNGILSLKARNTDKKELFIANIVFAFLSGVEINLVASIFALIKGDTIE